MFEEERVYNGCVGRPGRGSCRSLVVMLPVEARCVVMAVIGKFAMYLRYTVYIMYSPMGTLWQPLYIMLHLAPSSRSTSCCLLINGSFLQLIRRNPCGEDR